MVKVCPYNYPKSRETPYAQYYEKYSYPLHDFQKWCVEAIVEGHHVLVTAPTGSGKTFGGEFALDHLFTKGKKTIYCSPIKALSNQKFYDFTRKYPHISVGLITGDIKTNPDADVLIMTTEILLNKLYQIKSSHDTPSTAVSFDMNIETELGCVVFDEIHMINDENRGHVWEQSIMLLPKHIQMVGLSATLDDPERFAYWLETRGNPLPLLEKVEQNWVTSSRSIGSGIEGNPVEEQNPKGGLRGPLGTPVDSKIVYLASKLERSVPLIHYSFLTTTAGVSKTIKDKVVQEEINGLTNKLVVLKNANGEFSDINYNKVNKVVKLFEHHNIRIHRQYVLNKVAEHLVNNEMLPALCYVFSRKQLEICAREMTTNILEFDSKVPYTIDRECEQIIRKLPNYQEYLHLPEYVNLVTLLRKGVGIHHAGLMPVLREMVELLFARGCIKILFCTETMSVGINLPVKTTIFTDVNKFDGNHLRMLYGHEYTQAAGRAGRLGLDTVGHVVHLNNLFRNLEHAPYKTMMKGDPQALVSKFKISYNLLLNLIDIGDNKLLDFSKRSMITNDIDSQLGELYGKMNKLNDELESMTAYSRTPVHVVEEYLELSNKKQYLVNKKRKDVERQIQSLLDENKFLEQDKHLVQKYAAKRKEYDILQSQYNGTEQYLNSQVTTIFKLLVNEGFIADNQLTPLGVIASNLREVHCLVFANLYKSNDLDALTSQQLVSLFSCFTNVNVCDDKKDSCPKAKDTTVQRIVGKVAEMYDECQRKETFDTGVEYSIHYDLLNYVIDWCDCQTEVDCKLVLQKLGQEKEIFLGEFVKALLKINNISAELEKVAELTGNVSFLSKLKEIPNMTLKYVVTNQSLYV
jgi:superfamily II RNA helicase